MRLGTLVSRDLARSKRRLLVVALAVAGSVALLVLLGGVSLGLYRGVVAPLLPKLPVDLLKVEPRTVSVGLLAFDAADVEKVGARLQCNPPIRTARHREALWRALQDGSVPLVCSDHCPQGLSSKRVPYPHSASGMPTIEWLLPAMLTAREARGFALTDLARWLSDAPARAFGLARKGRLEVGYDADVVLVDPCMEREVTDSATLSRAGWSPFAGRILRGWPRSVWAHGRAVLRDGELFPRVRGRPLNPLSRSPSP